MEAATRQGHCLLNDSIATNILQTFNHFLWHQIMLPKRDWQKLLVLNLLSSSLFIVFSYYVVLWVISYSLVVEIFDCVIMSNILNTWFRCRLLCLTCIEFTSNFSLYFQIKLDIGLLSFLMIFFFFNFLWLNPVYILPYYIEFEIDCLQILVRELAYMNFMLEVL